MDYDKALWDAASDHMERMAGNPADDCMGYSDICDECDEKDDCPEYQGMKRLEAFEWRADCAMEERRLNSEL
jgi:hypothetical protein